MKNSTKYTSLFYMVILLTGMLILDSCGKKTEEPVPSISVDNIVGVWSTSIVVKKDNGAADVSFFGEMTYSADKTGRMKFDGFDESNFDWKSDQSTITITNADGVQVYTRSVDDKDDQVMSREEVVDEVTSVFTVTMTRK